jgi:hypothetical protein
VDQFDIALGQLTQNVETINERKVVTQDVSAEFVDTRARIEARKQVRLRYMDLLGQARNMQEILSVQTEINGIQEQIESATGRIQYLGHAALFSTIHLTFYQVLNASASKTDQPSFRKELSQAFKTGWHWLSDVFIGLVSVWPLLFVGSMVVWVYRKRKTRPARA